MTRRSALVWCLAASVASAHAAVGQTPFVARTDSVVVDVTVRQGQANVTDLASTELRLLDNGVPQQVTIDAHRQIPMDLWVLADTSNLNESRSVRVAFPGRVRAISGLLRAGDRVALVSVANPARIVIPLTPVPLADVPVLPIRGYPQIADGLADVLLIPSLPSRRHVVMVEFSATDVDCLTSTERLRAIAARSDAQVDLFYSAHGRTSESFKKAIQDLARSSGGAIFETDAYEDAVRQLLASLEHTYVLTYTACGVPAKGWHTIDVSVTRPGTFTVGARHGYFVQ